MSVDAYRQKILPVREQAAVRNRWLKQRLDDLLPELMAREGFDMWVIVCREYNEDPVLMSLLPEPAMSARRRTILVFTRQDDGTVERLSLDRYGWGEYYQRGWEPEKEGQFECLARVIRERDPEVIGINLSETFAFGDGLSHSEYQFLAEAVGEELMGRTKSAERLCIGWLERRIEPEMGVYPGLVEIGHALIAEAYSSKVIQPGITTTDDVVWWMRQKMSDLGLKAWFQPSCEIQAQGLSFEGDYSERNPKRKLILPGDLLHCDVGFHYLGLATDQQQHAYILRPGETAAPAGLQAALADGNRLQEIHMEQMTLGWSGNEVLSAVREQAQSEGIVPCVYSHPLGYHGHAAGPTIGLWDQQGGVAGKGDYPLFDDTCYSIELNVEKVVPEWDDQKVRIALEEDAVLSGGKMWWLNGRQTALHLVG